VVAGVGTVGVGGSAVGAAVGTVGVGVGGNSVGGASVGSATGGTQPNTSGQDQSGGPNVTDRLVVAPTVFGDVAGQVATEDGTVAVRGRAVGQDEVLVVMVDRRGRVASQLITVDKAGTFEDDNVPLVTPRGQELSEGPIVAAVFAVGRDGIVGDGTIAGFTRADLEALDEGTRQQIRSQFRNRTLTQQQVLELFYDNSIGAAGSDDLALLDAFRYTTGRTSIEAVGPTAESNLTGIQPVSADDTVVVQGLTNRKPDDNTITVEAIDGPTPQAIAVNSTSIWGTDGVWSVTLDTRGAEPGTYTIKADDGDHTDRVRVEVLPAGNASAGGNATAGGASNATTS